LKLWRGCLIIISILLVFSFVSVGMAASEKNCKEIKWRKGKVYVIKGALYKSTHIILPEKLLQAPICANELWTCDGKLNHVLVMPNSAEKEGKETTMTLITETNESYDFILRRVDKNPDACVLVKTHPSYFSKEVSDYKTPEEKKSELLEGKIRELNREIADKDLLINKRVEDALRKYRSYIYTRYTWSKGSGFMGSELISDVYDDGRFTFIRFTADNRGLLAVTAEIDGKKELIEYKKDSTDIYKICGIYPKFILKYGKSKITIKREDNLSNGTY